jgi:TorA maturation chaperone TorD
MHTREFTTEAAALDLAREALYRFLAAAVADPHTRNWRLIVRHDDQQLARDAAAYLREEKSLQVSILGPGELPLDQLDLRPFLHDVQRPVCEIGADYDRIFGLLTCRECPPYETEYHPTSEAFFRTQQLADIAGFYRAFGLEPGRATSERPDHIALELEFMAFMLLKKRLALRSHDAERWERADICDNAQRLFFREHLAWWLPAFATGLLRKAGSGFYASLARILAAFVAAERGHFEVPPSRRPLQVTLIEPSEEQAGCASCGR